MRDLQSLVDDADPDALLLAVDGMVSSRDWDELVDLARRCREAVELGRQLWPVAMHIDYRLALLAPAGYAGAVVRPGAGRFALGPLTEVAATHHDWQALAPHLSDPASAGAVAQERVIRGETLTGRDDVPPAEVPLRLADWEPAYALASYRDREAAFPRPRFLQRPPPAPQPLGQPGLACDPDHAVRALSDIVATWTDESAGSVTAVAVQGGAEAAVAHLRPVAGLIQIAPDEALAWLQWAGASGGAYGRRRGGAAGRFGAWWAAAALSGLDWPADQAELDAFADRLGQAVGELRWYRWSPPEPETGWTLRLAVTDPPDGLSWAIDAVDHREEP